MEYKEIIELKECIKELTEAINHQNKRVFTRVEASKYLRIGLSAMDELIRNGEIKYKKNGTNYLFPKEYLDDWLLKDDIEVIERPIRIRKV